MALMDLLKLVASGSEPSGNAGEPAPNPSTADLGHALTAALHSDQTPSFPQLFSQVFASGGAEQKAGLINQVLSAIGPAAVAALSQGALGRFAGQSSPVTPEQAAQISPEEAQHVATQAQQIAPGITELVGHFLAQHQDLLKSLGSEVAAVALSHLEQRSKGA